MHTAELYEDVSDNESFGEYRQDFLQEVNRLEREYFDSLHVGEAQTNSSIHAAAQPRVSPDKHLSDFERAHFHEYNVTPDRPCSAYFRTEAHTTASDIFGALKKDGFLPEHIRCLQRKPSGEIFITFRSRELRDIFLSKSSLTCKNRPYAAGDAEGTTTYLTIYDAPYELPDTAIIHRLRPYCEVLWYRRGTYRGHDGIFNGLRHYRVRVTHEIPSFLRFGKFLIRLYHDGQDPTCRRCNRTGHQASACFQIVCFNCDGLGHQARECIRPMYCCICKSGQHLARQCPFSWHRPTQNVQPIPAPAVTQPPEHAVQHSDQDEMDHASVTNAVNDRDQSIDQPIDQPIDEPPVAAVPQPIVSPVVDPESFPAEESVLTSQGFIVEDDSPPDSPPDDDVDSPVSVHVSVSDDTPADPADESVAPVDAPTGLAVPEESDSPSLDLTSESQPSQETSWADIVDRGLALHRLPQILNARPARNSKSLGRRKPARTACTSVPARKPTRPSLSAPKKQSTTDHVNIAVLESDRDDMESEDASRKRKDPPSES